MYLFFSLSSTIFLCSRLGYQLTRNSQVRPLKESHKVAFLFLVDVNQREAIDKIQEQETKTSTLLRIGKTLFKLIS